MASCLDLEFPQYTGNPDITGIGTFYSLLLSVVLGVCGCAVFLLNTHLSKKQQRAHIRTQTRGAQSKLSVALEAALIAYLDPMLLFSLIFHITAYAYLYRMVYCGPDSNSPPVPFYERAAISYNSLISLQPPLLCLNTPYLGGILRRKRLKLIFSGICVLLALTPIVVLQRIVFWPQSGDIEGIGKWNGTLASSSMDCKKLMAARAASIVPAVWTLLSCWVASLLYWMWALRNSSDLQPLLRRVCDSISNFLHKHLSKRHSGLVHLLENYGPLTFSSLVMLAQVATSVLLLGDFYKRREREKRFEINTYPAKVSTWADETWSFGQILSVFVWVPVMVEFGYVWMFGEEQLAGRVSKRWEIRAVDQGTCGDGKQRERRWSF